MPIEPDDIPAILIALTGIIGAVTAFFTAAWSARNVARQTQQAAKKDDVDLLRGEVERLQTRVQRLTDENDQMHAAMDLLRMENLQLRVEMSNLKAENRVLRSELAKHGIEIPSIMSGAEK